MRVQEVLKKHNVDAWVIFTHHSHDIHLRYLLEKWFASPTFIIIPKSGQATVITSTMEAMMVNKEDYTVIPYTTRVDFINSIKSILAEYDKANVALNFVERDELLDFLSMDIISYGTKEFLTFINPKINFVSAKDIIYDIRSVKTKEEIENHKIAVKLAEELMHDVIEPTIKPGMTESEIAALIEFECKKRGEVAFGAIVASGPNSAIPHHKPGNRKIKENEVLLIDYGVSYNMSQSDLTHTYWIGPDEPPVEVIKAYKAVDAARKKAFELIKAGIISSEVEDAVRKTFEEHGYDHEKLFIHSTGHPLGIETHDIGVGIRRATPETPGKPLLENSIITVEPGLYFEGKFGIRLEDDVLVTKNGAIRLSHTPSELIVL